MIKSVAEIKRIGEVIHFTTNSGLLGILAKGAVLPNSKLKEEDTLAFVFNQNSEQRKEKNKEWLNYVNLSISKINKEFFSYSQYIHRSKELFWCILSFSIDLLNDDGVYFTTTNNIYPSCLRGIGLESFKRMFNDPIVGKFQRNIYRQKGQCDSWTTCEQAEVLYPGQLSLKYLQCIYVPNIEAKYSVCAQLAALDVKHEIIVSPEKFK